MDLRDQPPSFSISIGMAFPRDEGWLKRKVREDVTSPASCELPEQLVREQLRTDVLLITEGRIAETIGIAEQGHRRPRELDPPPAEPDGGVRRMVPLP